MKLPWFAICTLFELVDNLRFLQALSVLTALRERLGPQPAILKGDGWMGVCLAGEVCQKHSCITTLVSKHFSPGHDDQIAFPTPKRRVER